MNRSTLVFALCLVGAGCSSKKHCGDGGMAITEDDGGVICIDVPDDDGSGGSGGGTGGSGGHIAPDGGGDGPGGFCGDLICNNGETCSTCPNDCGSCTGFCGDGICNNGETCSTCSTDCGQCAFCGDGVCNNGETCSTCSTDCGSCPDAAPSCPPPQEIFSTVTATTTAGTASCATLSCGTNTANAPDVTYYFVPSTTGTCHAQTTGGSTNFDTVLAVRTSPTGPDLPNGCNDDNGMGMTPSTASYVTWSATAFTTYYIIVDGYNGAAGTFTLTVACP